MHTPVLLHEVIDFLNLREGSFVIDGTLDGGGHAAAILEKVGPKGKVLGIDQDEEMIARAKIRFEKEKNFSCVRGNYAELPEILKREKFGKADGLLLDLGFSSEQLEHSGWGFSFERDEPLMMTYNREAAPVKQLLRELDERMLAKVIFELSGEKFARRIAKAIKEEGRKRKIETTRELRTVIERATPKHYERGRINPATRTFQALRIYANHEFENLETVLANLKDVVTSDGRAVVISFHSLEDRIVKNAFRKMEKDGDASILTKKPVAPTTEEIIRNPRSRSAKLRAVIVE
jgi:16S rRNA (cytosine1402-N4)-methyltransferase